MATLDKEQSEDEGFDITGPPDGFFLNYNEIWRYRELVYIFTWRDIVSKYKQTILGFLWVIIQPLSMIMLFTFFFSGTLNISTDDIPPPVFYFSGLLVWNFFSAAMQNSSNSIVQNAHVISKIYFPRLILPLAYVFIALFDFLIAFAIFSLVIIGYEITMPEFDVNYLRFCYYPLSLLMIVLSSFGIGGILAALNVRFRDFRLITGFIIQFIFYLTPVIYPVSVFESELVQKVLAFNPAFGAVELMRSPFVNTPVSSIIVMIGCISSVFIFLTGVYLFRKMEYYFADLI